MLKVLRITRHPLCESRAATLKVVFGSDVIITTKDVPFGSDPVATLKELITSEEANGDQVVAIDLVAPFSVQMKLVDARLPVKIIRAEFARGADGRNLSFGKDSQGFDIQKFERYKVLKRIIMEEEPLLL